MADLLTRVRDVLADPSGERWSDAVLLRLLNDGINDFVTQTKALQETVYIELTIGEPSYDLSGRFISISRIQYQDKVIPLVSRADMDKKDLSWRAESGIVTAAIYDTGRPARITLYPVPTYGDTANIITNSDYGIIVDINYSAEIIDIIEDLGTFDISEYFSVFGVVKPTTILTKEDDFPIDTTWQYIINHYIVGNALRADMDTQNREMGNEELNIYSSKVKEISKDVGRDFTAAAELTTKYRGI